jgi:hypothetical protein
MPGGVAAIPVGGIAAVLVRARRPGAGGKKGGKMSLKEEIRLKAELRAASVLLSALMRQTDAEDVRNIFENAVVRETAHMLERGARSEAIRAFEDAVGEWAIRGRQRDKDGPRHAAPQRRAGGPQH